MGQFISFKSEINNPWFNPWFILLHTHSNVCATVEGRCLEYLVCITLKKSAKMEGITQEKMQGYENMNAPSEKISTNCKGVRIRTKRALALQVPACTSQCLILALTYSSHIFLRTNVLQWLEIFDFGMTKSGKIRHTDKDWWILRPMSVCVSVCF